MQVRGRRGKRRFQAASSRAARRGGEGEQEFVVFTVAHPLGGRGAGSEGKEHFIHGISAAAGGSESRQIGGQAVAEVHHRVQLEVGDQPAGFREARLEIEMLARERVSEAAGHVERVARLAGGPEHTVRAFHPPGQRDIEKERAGRPRRFAADQAHPMARGRPSASPRKCL